MNDFKDALGMVLVAICVSAMIAAPVACNNHDNGTIQKLVEGGADPVAARCAVAPGSVHAGVCLAQVLKGSK